MRELCLNEIQVISGALHSPEEDVILMVMAGTAGLVTGAAVFVCGGAFLAGFAYGTLGAAFVITETMI